LRPAPRLFWGVILYALALSSIMLAATMAAGPPADEPLFQWRMLVVQARLSEGQTILVPEDADSPVPTPDMTSFATQAGALASQPETPAALREQAAAMWMIYGGQAQEGDDKRVLSNLLPTPENRTEFGRLVAELAAGGDLTDRQVLADADVSPWLKSRLTLWLKDRRAPMPADSDHAKSERPFVEKTASVLGFFGMFGLLGLLLLASLPWLLRRFRGRGLPPAPWANEWWVPWYVVAAWFAVSATAQLALSSAVGLGGLIVVQLASGLIALRLIGQQSLDGQRGFAGVLFQLRVGVAPFGGQAMPPLLWGFLAWCAALPIMLLCTLLQSMLPIESHLVSNPVLPEIVAADSGFNTIILFVAVVGLAPFFEEIIFRGFLYRQLRARSGPLGAALVSAAVFSAVHLSPGTIVPLFGLGLLLAAVTERSGGLLPAMLLHGLWNGGSLVLAGTLYSGAA